MALLDIRGRAAVDWRNVWVVGDIFEYESEAGDVITVI